MEGVREDEIALSSRVVMKGRSLLLRSRVARGVSSAKAESGTIQFGSEGKMCSRNCSIPGTSFVTSVSILMCTPTKFSFVTRREYSLLVRFCTSADGTKAFNSVHLIFLLPLHDSDFAALMRSGCISARVIHLALFRLSSVLYYNHTS
jgi:hypothetical protein